MATTSSLLRRIGVPASSLAIVAVLASPSAMEVFDNVPLPNTGGTSGEPGPRGGGDPRTDTGSGVRPGSGDGRDGTESSDGSGPDTPGGEDDPRGSRPGACSPRAPTTGPAATSPTTRVAVSICVGIPPIAFTQNVEAVNGRLRTPVLVNIGATSGSVSVQGVRDGSRCALTARPGVVAWIDCRITRAGSATPRIVVRLRDGRTATHAITMS